MNVCMYWVVCFDDHPRYVMGCSGSMVLSIEKNLVPVRWPSGARILLHTNKVNEWAYSTDTEDISM